MNILFDIYLINMDGSNLIKYLSLSTDYGLMLNPDNSDWSQDGKNLVFASDNSSASSLNYQIYVMNIN